MIVRHSNSIDATVFVSCPGPGEDGDLTYTINSSGGHVIEFRQDPVDKSTFRRYVDGVRK